MYHIVFWLFVLLILHTYFIYPGILYLFNNIFCKRRKSNYLNIAPNVSLIITAYNEEKLIAQKIKNCLELEYPQDKLEIIVGSDGSTDETENIIKRYNTQGVKLYRFKRRNGKIGVLNNIIPQVKAEIVLFSDANTIFENDAIKKLVRNFADPRVGCVCGELVFKNAKENEVGSLEGFYWRYEQFLKRIEGLLGALLGANGGIYAIRKSLFQPLPANVIVEDFVIPMRILEKGYKVVYEPQAIAYEETSKKIVQEMERRIRIGAGDFQALLLTWRMLNPLRGFSTFAYFSHKVIRWFVPFLLITVFLTNIALLGSPFYTSAFIMQCLFYTIAIVGRLLSRLNIRLKMFRLPYYFVSMNLALLFGFIRFCTNSQSVTWQRTER